MKGKIKTTLLIAVLLISTITIATALVPFLPDDYGVFQSSGATGAVEWTDSLSYSGDYSAYIMAELPDDSDSNEVYIHSIDPKITTLDDLESMSYWYYRPTTGDVLPPQVDIWLDTDGTYTLGPIPTGDEDWLLGQIPLQEPPVYETWISVPFSEIVWIYADGGEVFGAGSTGLDAAKASTNSGSYLTLGDCPVIAIGVGVGSPATRDNTRTMEHQYYIDDIEINDIIYDFEEYPALDDDWYNIGDTVTVTVFDNAENVRPFVADIIMVTAYSGYPDQIEVTLTETGTSTGYFQGTFTVVDSTSPGPTELLVGDAITITVEYTDVLEKIYTVTADVDAEAPEITPGASTYTLDEVTRIAIATPTISATYDKVDGSDIDFATMKLDGDIVALQEAGTSITYPVVDALSEGLHEVKVTVSDAAGNIATETWTFFVDLTKPTVSISVSPNPAGPNIPVDTVEPIIPPGTITFTLAFSEKMVGDPTVKFGLANYPVSKTTWDVAMLVWTGTYDLTGWTSTNDGTQTVTVSLATDEAGNVMAVDASTTFVIDTIAPSTPLELAATVTDVSVTLDWTASTDEDGTGVDEYLIELGTNKVGRVNHPTITFTHYLPIEGTNTYYVTAIDVTKNEAAPIEVLVEFVPGDVIAREIALSEGWNLISLQLIPDDSSITVVLEDVMENVKSVWGYDDGWSSYLTAVPEFSTLTDLVDGEGYWVEMTADDSVIVYGVELPGPGVLPPVYSVSEGWNLIGFKSVGPMDIETYLTTIPETVMDSSVCYGWDATNQEYEMVYIGTILTAEQFYPGHGYWLYLTEDANIAPPVLLP